MLHEVLLPQLGQTMEEGKIEKWHKAEGDTVKKGEVLFELTTDKATLEVESFAEGVLKKIVVPEGETVPVNDLIAVIGGAEDELPADLAALRKRTVRPAVSSQPAQAGTGAAAGAPPAAQPVPRPERGRVFASPRARKLSAEMKIPIACVQGTGPNGRIVEKDVRAYAEKLEEVRFTPAARELAFSEGVDLLALKPSSPGERITKQDVLAAAQAAPAARPAAAGQRIPLTPMRTTIATRMTASKQTVPHFYLVGDVRMAKAIAFRTELNAAAKAQVSLTGMLVKATALALKAHPRVNSRFDRDAIVQNEDINVGVAVAVEDGLFVPVVKSADSKDLARISSEIKELAETARAGKLVPEQYEGGCVTISNLGMYGVDYFLPIINPPESCIIGIGQLAEQVVVRDGAIAIEPVLKISISADHRAVDGAEAAEFFQTFREILLNPERLREK